MFGFGPCNLKKNQKIADSLQLATSVLQCKLQLPHFPKLAFK
jgi:hypothetical protein